MQLLAEPVYLAAAVQERAGGSGIPAGHDECECPIPLHGLGPQIHWNDLRHLEYPLPRSRCAGDDRFALIDAEVARTQRPHRGASRNGEIDTPAIRRDERHERPGPRGLRAQGARLLVAAPAALPVPPWLQVLLPARIASAPSSVPGVPVALASLVTGPWAAAVGWGGRPPAARWGVGVRLPEGRSGISAQLVVIPVRLR